MARAACHQPLSVRLGLCLRLGCAAALAQLATRLAATDLPPAVVLSAQIAPGMRTTQDQPMCVLWIEDADGRFVRTLWLFGKAAKYNKDLTVWHALSQRQERPAEVDAVTGATIIQGDTGRLRIPTRWQGLDLFSGRYVLRVESRKDHDCHYTGLRIPLGPTAIGRAVADEGYVRSLVIAADPSAAAPPAAVQALPSIPPGAVVQSPASATDTHEPRNKDHP